MAAGLELTGKSDLRFTDTLYKVTDRIKLVLQAEKRKDYQPLVLNTAISVCFLCLQALRDLFHYKPVLTKQQFLQWGFSERKISVVCDIINLVLQKHNQLQKVRDLFFSIYFYMSQLQDA